MEYVGGACCLLVIALVVLGVLLSWMDNRRFWRWSVRPGGTRTVCIHCQGQGWIEQKDRTLEFTGNGFADQERPSIMCPVCQGTGQIYR